MWWRFSVAQSEMTSLNNISRRRRADLNGVELQIDEPTVLLNNVFLRIIVLRIANG